MLAPSMGRICTITNALRFVIRERERERAISIQHAQIRKGDIYPNRRRGKRHSGMDALIRLRNALSISHLLCCNCLI